MINLTFSEFEELRFELYPDNPILRRVGISPVVADPSVLTPDLTPDKRWRLFCHNLFGVYELTSTDGICFEKPKRIARRAMRPNVNFTDGKYLFYYERTKPLIGNALSLLGGKWKSEIYVAESENADDWSKPRLALGHTRRFEDNELGVSLSNPFLLKIGGLYYSCGLTFIPDCGFSEPTHISYAESLYADKDFIAAEKPLISPDENDPYLNICSGCIKVYRLKDAFIGIQNGIYKKDGESRSAIMLMRSDDGLRFRFVKTLVEPDPDVGNGWMAQYVYASHLVQYNEELRLYFNARNTSSALGGREHIGFASARL